jgi:hypothetical protein
VWEWSRKSQYVRYRTIAATLGPFSGREKVGTSPQGLKAHPAFGDLLRHRLKVVPWHFLWIEKKIV